MLSLTWLQPVASATTKRETLEKGSFWQSFQLFFKSGIGSGWRGSAVKSWQKRPGLSSWREIIMGVHDSEILLTESDQAEPSPSERYLDLRSRKRLARVAQILEQRGMEYGDANELHSRLAALWGARLGVKLDAPMVLLMMLDLKTTRSTTSNLSPSQDTLDDIIGYAALYAKSVAG